MTCEHNLEPYEADFGVMESWRNKYMHLIGPPDNRCTKCGECFWNVKGFPVNIGLVNLPNKNGRIYPREIWEKVIAESRQPVLGFIGMPTNLRERNIEEVSHKVENLRIEGDYFVGDVTAFDTPRGEILQTLFHSVDFRVAGEGVITDNVVTSFRLLSINAVHDGA